MKHKEKFGNLDFIKIKTFALQKSLLKYKKASFTWDKTFAKDIHNKEVECIT